MKHPGRSIFVVLLLAAFALVFLLQTGALAEKWRIVEDNDGCDENRWSREEYACEVREIHAHGNEDFSCRMFTHGLKLA